MLNIYDTDILGGLKFRVVLYLPQPQDGGGGGGGGGAPPPHPQLEGGLKVGIE